MMLLPRLSYLYIPSSPGQHGQEGLTLVVHTHKKRRDLKNFPRVIFVSLFVVRKSALD